MENNLNSLKRVMEKQELRYVLATTISGEPMYLKKKLQKSEYKFVSDNCDATKCTSKKMAQFVKDFYRHDTGDYHADLVIIPLVISYELVKEI